MTHSIFSAVVVVLCLIAFFVVFRMVGKFFKGCFVVVCLIALFVVFPSLFSKLGLWVLHVIF